MAEWDTSQYYSFREHTNQECIQIATDLLNSYSLTRGCLETLGQELVQQLKFGFFSKSDEIIIQGESGRDIFLLCTGNIDVLVDGQVVVEMKAPTLVGDKGIVSANSQRAATIKISSEDPSLVIKIPMETFIRDFRDTSIPDESFVQEKSIFQNVFQIVQERLFDFIYLQKTLWEQANNTIQAINQQIYAKQLDNKIDPAWSADSWRIAQNYVKSKLNVSWPQNIPVNAKSLHAFLRKYFDVKYKNAKQPEDLIKMKLEWRNILTEIAGRVLRNIPDEKKAIKPLDLELFNPNIYRMRLTGLQNQLEKRYASKLVKAGTDKNKPSFFGTGDRSNEFNLPLYLDYFFKMYKVNNPRRLLAQVGQKCALIAAECENNFNSSVVKMQKFLEEVKSRNISLGENKKESKVDPALVKSWTAALTRGVQHFRDSSPSIEGQTLGVIKFSENTYPNFTNMVKSHRVQFTRDKMNQAFINMIKASGFQTEYLSNQMLFNVFHLCGVERGDTIPEAEIRNNYWFPLTDHIKLNEDDSQIVSFKARTPIGGELWNSNYGKDGDKPGKRFSLSTEDTTVMMVLPARRLPWKMYPSPDDQVMVEQHLPLMQWFVDRTFELFQNLQNQRDEIVDEWTEIKDGIVRSEKIAVFEQKALKLPKADYNRIISWLNSTLGLKLKAEEILPSNKLSKRIYNFFLHKATEENPDMSIEQRGNQAYTKWRNLLFELTDQIPALNKVVSKLPGKDPRPVTDVLEKQLTPLIAPLMKEIWEKQNPITSGSPNLNLMLIVHPDKHESPEEAVTLYNNIMDILGKNIFQLILEIKQHRETLNELYEFRSKSEVSSATSSEQIDMRQESIKNLLKMLHNM